MGEFQAFFGYFQLDLGRFEWLKLYKGDFVDGLGDGQRILMQFLHILV